MKKLITIAMIVMIVSGLIILGCSKRNTTTPVEEDTPTATITNTPGAPTATPTNTLSASAGLIDDCEDGDNVNLWSGAWYTYDDTPNSGTSWIWPPSSTLTMSSGGYNSSYALHVSGQVKAGYAYPFAGVGAQLTATAGCSDCAKTDISSYSGVRFWIKGSLDSTLNLNVILPYTGACDAGACATLSGYNDFKFTITSNVSGVWSQVVIPFSSFTTGGTWGTPPANISTVQAAASEFQFQFKGPDNYAGTGLNFDVWIDYLELY